MIQTATLDPMLLACSHAFRNCLRQLLALLLWARHPADIDCCAAAGPALLSSKCKQYNVEGWLGSRVVSVLYGLRRRRVRVQIAVATLSGNSLRQTAHTHRVSVHQAAKLVAALLKSSYVHFFLSVYVYYVFLLWAASCNGLMPSLAACHCNS